MVEIEHNSIELEKTGLNTCNEEYATKLHLAVKDNNWRYIQRLIEDGVHVQSVDKFGRTPLHWALVFGYQKVAYALIINTPKAGLDYQDNQGCTPLHYAALGGRTDVGRILLEQGALINSTDSKERTPLHYAAQNATPDMVEMLVSRGANKTCLDYKGFFPCDIAVEWGSFTSLACLRHNFQEKAENISVSRDLTNVDFAKVEMGVQIQGQGKETIMSEDKDSSEDHPSLDKLMSAWKNIQNKAKLTRKLEAARATEASITLEDKLEEWREAEQEAKERKCQGQILIHNISTTCTAWKNETSDGTEIIPQSTCWENDSNFERNIDAPITPLHLTNSVCLSSSSLPSCSFEIRHDCPSTPIETSDQTLIYPKLDVSSSSSIDTLGSSIPEVNVSPIIASHNSPNSILWAPIHVSSIPIPPSFTSLSNLRSPNPAMSRLENTLSHHDMFYWCRSRNSNSSCSTTQHSEEADFIDVDRENDPSRWCTEWEIEIPESSTLMGETPQNNKEMEELAPTNSCNKSTRVDKGKEKEKAFFEEEPIWLQVWPKPSSSSSSASRS